MARYAPHLSLVVRKPDLEKSMSRYLADGLASMPSVDVLALCEVRR